MVFTSVHFLKFFAAFLCLFSIARNRRQRQMVILGASVVFYGSWNVRYLLLLATPSIIDYYCALGIEASNSRRVRKAILWASVCSNLGLLAYFKYTNFLLSSLGGLFHFPHRSFDILLPVGISFYIFKTMSYTVDVYRGQLRACRSWWRYAMFVTYFPELVAGPIVRASVFLPQMGRSLRFNKDRFLLGLQIIMLGVTKKLVIADRLAPFADRVFAAPASFDGITNLLAVIAYSLQIYCDFSGYSDIAIGISKIIGYDLPENFNMPYAAASLTDFWRRWHMTLSTWLRDYLYIPLGGNRGGKTRTRINLILTMLLGGLWHGASWTFVFWGLLHGVGLMADKFLWRVIPPGRVTRALGWATTYAYVCLAWVFFRAGSFRLALTMLHKIVALDASGVRWIFTPLLVVAPFVVVAHLMGLHTARIFEALKRPSRKATAPPVLRALYGSSGTMVRRPSALSGIYVLLPSQTFWYGMVATMWVAVILLFFATQSSPFIYFQF
jgi:alginate O-acetyltransferase complex protein AlgI